MFEEILKTIADILSGHEPDPDGHPDDLKPDDILRILRKRRNRYRKSN